MDLADKAQIVTDANLARALSESRRHDDTNVIIRLGIHYCIDCDIEIHEERVKALHKAGQPASRCVECQLMHERYKEVYTR